MCSDAVTGGGGDLRRGVPEQRNEGAAQVVLSQHSVSVLIQFAQRLPHVTFEQRQWSARERQLRVGGSDARPEMSAGTTAAAAGLIGTVAVASIQLRTLLSVHSQREIRECQTRKAEAGRGKTENDWEVGKRGGSECRVEG